MLTSDDPNPPHLCNLPIENLISLYYLLCIRLVRIDFFTWLFQGQEKGVVSKVKASER